LGLTVVAKACDSLFFAFFSLHFYPWFLSCPKGEKGFVVVCRFNDHKERKIVLSVSKDIKLLFFMMFICKKRFRI